MGKVLVTARISLQNERWDGEGKGEGKPMCTIVDNSLTMLSFPLLHILKFFNLSGVPSPLLPVTPIRIHSLVRVPSDGKDFIDYVNGGRKGWGT